MKIVIVKMNIKNPNESYQVTQQQLLQLPKSRYRPDNYYKKLLSPQPEAVSAVPSIHEDSDATLPYSSSGEKSPLPRPTSSLPDIHVDSDATLPYSSSDATLPYSSSDETIPYWD